ncbi:MAG: ribosome small subunit-dependent GTPase A [Candidatus Promineifilaceae bacterium]
MVKAQSGFFTVEGGDGRRFVCQIPGRLKKERQESDLVAVGDRVTVRPNPDGTSVIEAVAERKRVLSRARPAAERRSLLSDQEQVLVANLDQVVLVFSVRQPEPSLRKLDRFLVITERNQVPALVCVNKVDLAEAGEAEAKFDLYAGIGYPVVYTSAKRGDGIQDLRNQLQDKLSVFAGSSGVGKTSLLNAVQPGLGRRVQQVSRATEKGLHTTRHVELVPLAAGGYVADTPGIRSLALYDLEPGELDAYFREIAPLVADCQFSDCSHTHEPGCAVRAAVAAGAVAPARYESYLRLREEHESLEEDAY